LRSFQAPQGKAAFPLGLRGVKDTALLADLVGQSRWRDVQ